MGASLAEILLALGFLWVLIRCFAGVQRRLERWILNYLSGRRRGGDVIDIDKED